MFDIGKPAWVKGTVVALKPVNPHVMIELEQKGDDGQVQRLTVEGPGLNSFTRAGYGPDFVQVGDVIEACGFGLKEEVLARNAGRAALGSARPVFHGHVLVMPGRPHAALRRLRQARELRSAGRPGSGMGGVREHRPEGSRRVVQQPSLRQFSLATAAGVRRRGQPLDGGSLSAAGSKVPPHSAGCVLRRASGPRAGSRLAPFRPTIGAVTTSKKDAP